MSRSSTLALIENRRAVNDSLDITLSANYSYTDNKSDQSNAYTWSHTESADFGVSGGGLLYQDQFQAGQNDPLTEEDPAEMAWFLVNNGLYGSYTVTGSQNFSDDINETGSYDSGGNVNWIGKGDKDIY